MRLFHSLQRATLIRRYKRFLADVELKNGETLTVHCPNSGSMKTCSETGKSVLLSDSQNPKRKLRYTWEMIRMGRTWVGVHSALSNKIVGKLLLDKKIPELSEYTHIQPEVAYGDQNRSRVDYLLKNQFGNLCYLEIKHSTMKVGPYAAFPDAKTERGRKHLNDLAKMVQLGHRAIIFFIVGRNDCSKFRPADEIDPEYGDTLRKVVELGVEPLIYRLQFSPKKVELTGSLTPTLN